MDIQKVFVIVETSEEKKVAVALFGLCAKVDPIMREGKIAYSYVYVDSDNAVARSPWGGNSNLYGKQEVTLDYLYEIAKRGFKEVWEPLPEGYRLVTDEERMKYPSGSPEGTMLCFPQDAHCEWKDQGVYGHFDPPSGTDGFTVLYAVPEDFHFDSVKVVRTVDGASKTVWISKESAEELGLK